MVDVISYNLKLHDSREAARFLGLLAGGEPVTFQTFADSKGNQPLTRILHGTLEQHGARLAHLNSQGAGVFVMVNAGDGRGRKAENVKGIRALFVDLDGAPLEPVMTASLKPQIVVESSPQRFHAYWLVRDCSLDEFTLLQAAIAAQFGGDPVVKDLPRVMRVPGFLHQKGEPFLTRIHETNRLAPYGVEEIVNGLELASLMLAASQTPRKGPATAATLSFATEPEFAITEGSRNGKLTSLAGALRRQGGSVEAILAALQVENAARCEPPLNNAEVVAIARSIGRYAPAEKQQLSHSRDDLVKMIEATDDFDELTGPIVGRVATSELRGAEQEVLLKAISKKARVSLGSLRRDAQALGHVGATSDTDHLSAARAVIDSFGPEDLIHCQSFTWRWRGDGVWRWIEDRELKQKIHEVAAGNKLTANVVGSILDMVKTEVNRPNHRFDSNNEAINCVNGELTLADGCWQLNPHTRDHFRTTMIPVAYDPAADAPRFRQFLDEVFAGDPDAAEKKLIVLEALGYTLVTSCHLEKFFMLIGAGANGKSVLLGVLAALVGREHVCAVQPSQFENRFQRAHLQGRLANIITEIAEGAEIADAQLKSLVSGEMTTAEHKHKDPFDFIPYAKHWFGTNHLPHTRDFSDALFRRAVILTFNNKFEGEKRDVHLSDALKSELPGIFNMALAGLQRLITNKAFTECSSSADIARQWRKESDQVAQFVDDSCFTGPGCRASSNDLYTRYQAWALSAGVRRTLNRNNFTARLKRLGFELGRGAGGTRMIEGICSKHEGVGNDSNAGEFAKFADLFG